MLQPEFRLGSSRLALSSAARWYWLLPGVPSDKFMSVRALSG
jgi:hypothetical protein